MSSSEGMSNGVSMINDTISNITDNKMIYIGLFIVILLCILTIYFLYTLMGTFLFLKVGTTVSQTTVPVICNKLSIFDAKFPELGNGKRKSFSFWIYINDMTKNYNMYKTVAAVSDNKDTNTSLFTTASPHIFLDKTNNKLYCHFYNKNNYTIDNFSSLSNIDNYMKSGIIIDYVPVQRWVHIAIIVNSDSLSTNIYAYVDADLVKVIRDDNNKQHNINDIDLTQTKYLLVGSDVTDVKNGPGFSGLISNFSCYNYELNQSDVSNLYQKGPVNGFLAYLGLGMYGVRTPIYKL